MKKIFQKISFKKVYKFVIKYWHYIALFILFTIIFIINFRGDKWLISNDNYSPELNPLLTFFRSIVSPAWRSYRGLGVASDSEQADILRAIIFWVFSPLFSKQLVSQLYMFFCLFLGVFSIGKLTSNILLACRSKVSPTISFFTASLIYLTTLWTIWVFNFPVMPYVAQYGLLPFILLVFYKFLSNQSWKNALLLFISGLLFSTVSLISTLFFISLISFALLGWSRLFEKGNFPYNFRGLVVGILVFILSQIFWILPFFSYFTSSASAVKESFVNEGITNSTIDLEQEKMTSSNTLRFYTRHLDIAENDKGEGMMFEDSENYTSYDLYKLIAFLPAFLSGIGIIGVISTKRFSLLPLFIFILLGWFGIANINPPFGAVYKYLSESSDTFRQVFRWSTSKFGNVLLIGFAFFGTVGLTFLIELFSRVLRKPLARKISTGGILFIFTISMLFFGGFLFNKHLVTSRSYSDIPQSYFILKDKLDDIGVSKRMVIFPPANNSYFREYSFGFYGSGFLHYLIENPLLEKALAIGSQDTEKAISEIENSYFSKDKNELISLLNKYEVELILVDRNLVKGRYGSEIDWTTLDTNISGLPLLLKEGNLEVYAISKETPGKYTSSVSGHYEKGYFTASQGYIDPLNIEYNSVEFDGSNIKIDYRENITNVGMEKVKSWNAFPTTLEYDVASGEVNAYPSLPLFAKQIQILPIKHFNLQISKYSNIIFGDNVINVGDLIDHPMTFDIPWGTNLRLTPVLEKNVLAKYNALKGYTAGECSGKKSLTGVNISYNQGIVIKSANALACIARPISIDSDIVAKIRLEWKAELGTVVGYCIYSGAKRDCINPDRYLITTASGSQVITELLPEVMKSSDSLSLIIYLPSHSDTTTSVTIKDISFTYYQLGNEVMAKTSGSIAVTNESLQLKIPFVQGAQSYRYLSSNGRFWDYSFEEGETTDFMISNKGLTQTVTDNTVYQYSDIVNPTRGSLYMYYLLGENKKGLPANVCVLHSNMSSCLASVTFPYIGSISRFGTFSSLNNSMLQTSFRAQSRSVESQNILHDFVLFNIPNAWKELKYKVGNVSIMSEKEMDSVGSPSTPIAYFSKNISTGIYSIPQAQSKYWIGINTISKTFIPKKLVEGTVLDGWKQAWVIDSSDNGNLIAIYWPNLLGYLGYSLVLVTLVILVSKSIQQNGKSKAKN